jgi:hypothetical protein
LRSNAVVHGEKDGVQGAASQSSENVQARIGRKRNQICQKLRQRVKRMLLFAAAVFGIKESKTHCFVNSAAKQLVTWD